MFNHILDKVLGKEKLGDNKVEETKVETPVNPPKFQKGDLLFNVALQEQCKIIQVQQENPPVYLVGFKSGATNSFNEQDVREKFILWGDTPNPTFKVGHKLVTKNGKTFTKVISVDIRHLNVVPNVLYKLDNIDGWMDEKAIRNLYYSATKYNIDDLFIHNSNEYLFTVEKIKDGIVPHYIDHTQGLIFTENELNNWFHPYTKPVPLYKVGDWLTTNLSKRTGKVLEVIFNLPNKDYSYKLNMKYNHNKDLVSTYNEKDVSPFCKPRYLQGYRFLTHTNYVGEVLNFDLFNGNYEIKWFITKEEQVTPVNSYVDDNFIEMCKQVTELPQIAKTPKFPIGYKFTSGELIAEICAFHPNKNSPYECKWSRIDGQAMLSNNNTFWEYESIRLQPEYKEERKHKYSVGYKFRNSTLVGEIVSLNKDYSYNIKWHNTSKLAYTPLNSNWSESSIAKRIAFQESAQKYQIGYKFYNSPLVGEVVSFNPFFVHPLAYTPLNSNWYEIKWRNIKGVNPSNTFWLEVDITTKKVVLNDNQKYQIGYKFKNGKLDELMGEVVNFDPTDSTYEIKWRYIDGRICTHNNTNWTESSIDGKEKYIEEETSSKFKVGDKVIIHYDYPPMREKFHKIVCEIVNIADDRNTYTVKNKEGIVAEFHSDYVKVAPKIEELPHLKYKIGDLFQNKNTKDIGKIISIVEQKPNTYNIEFDCVAKGPFLWNESQLELQMVKVPAYPKFKLHDSFTNKYINAHPTIVEKPVWLSITYQYQVKLSGSCSYHDKFEKWLERDLETLCVPTPKDKVTESKLETIKVPEKQLFKPQFKVGDLFIVNHATPYKEGWEVRDVPKDDDGYYILYYLPAKKLVNWNESSILSMLKKVDKLDADLIKGIQVNKPAYSIGDLFVSKDGSNKFEVRDIKLIEHAYEYRLYHVNHNVTTNWLQCDIVTHLEKVDKFDIPAKKLEDIKPIPAPNTSKFKVGDKVKLPSTVIVEIIRIHNDYYDVRTGTGIYAFTQDYVNKGEIVGSTAPVQTKSDKVELKSKFKIGQQVRHRYSNTIYIIEQIKLEGGKHHLLFKNYNSLGYFDENDYTGYNPLFKVGDTFSIKGSSSIIKITGLAEVVNGEYVYPVDNAKWRESSLNGKYATKINS